MLMSPPEIFMSLSACMPSSPVATERVPPVMMICPLLCTASSLEFTDISPPVMYTR